MVSLNRDWTTRDETKFIDGLGTYNDSHGEDPREYRKRLLLRYRDVLGSRRNWDGLDRQKIEAHVAKCLGEDLENGN